MNQAEFSGARPKPRSIFTYLQPGLPVVMGYAPVGIAYGVLAGQAGLSVWETLAISFFVYAGSSQFIGVAMWQAGADPAAIIVTTFFVNLRHLLMSAALSPYLKKYSKRWLAFFSAQLTDETFAVHSARLREGADHPGGALLGVNILAHLTWSASSIAGFLIGSQLGDPRRLGLDFALPAMFIALLFMQVHRRLDWLVAGLSGVLALVVPLVIPGRWNTIIAAVLAAAAGAILTGPPSRRSVGKGGETRAE